MSRIKSPAALRLLAVVFIAAVALVVAQTHQLIIPVFIGLISWSKIWIKSVSPKLGMLLVKNSVFIQLRKFALQISAHFFVKSHKPWRRMLTTLRVSIVEFFKNLFAAYLNLPLWLRTAIAIVVLLATAGSSFALFALLIIPQPLLDWFRARLSLLLKRLGVTQAFSAAWRLLVPKRLRERWYMYVKWTMGRQQVRTVKLLHEKVSKRSQSGSDSSAKEQAQPLTQPLTPPLTKHSPLPSTRSSTRPQAQSPDAT